MLNAEIRPATNCSAAELRAAMVEAFSDYAVPLRLGQSDFEAMMRQRGLDVETSRVAMVDGRIAAIWLTSVRDGRGYLISSGTRPAYRSKGLARLMANDSLSQMREAKVRSFQTEVLRDNETALSLYLSLGMTKRRLLDCYRVSASEPLPQSSDFRRVEWAKIAGQAGAVRDWTPTWQNSDEAVAAISDRVTCLARIDDAGLCAFVVLSAGAGTIHQMAVREGWRRKGIGQELLAAARQAAAGDLRLINVDHGDDGFRAFMARAGAEETAGQFELFMPL